MQAKTQSPKIRRLLVGIGVFLIFLSFFSFFLSLGMPGIGWVMAAVSLTLISMLTPYIGKRYAIISLILSSIHLFTVGPLSTLRHSSSTETLHLFSSLFFIIAVLLPFVAAFISIFAPNFLFHANRKIPPS